MKKYILLVLLSLVSFTAPAQDAKNLIPDADKGLFSNLNHIMRLPEGVHKIYNGNGDTIFDVLYTIEVTDGKWILYKGGLKSYFDILYTIMRNKDEFKEEFKVYKGADSHFNLIYSVKITRKGIEVYKGSESGFPKMVYSYENNK